MFGYQKDTQKNLKDLSDDTSIVIKDISLSISYTKTNKLITALYMVTDIVDKNEPLRNKLRTLGTGIISDIYTTPSNICSKISEIMSFLDIASAVNIISEMNCNILRKEFLSLDQSIKESINIPVSINKEMDLSEFLKEGPPLSRTLLDKQISSGRAGIGHQKQTGIGIQKGHTLMKALSGIEVSNRLPTTLSPMKSARVGTEDFSVLKRGRREEIIKIIKNNSNGATITDIKTQAQGPLLSCGEKTLQRELITMVKDNVLYRKGSKRWSRYFVK